MKIVKAGLFGLGVVGKGVFHALSSSREWPVELKRICVKNPGKPREEAATALLTFRKEDILEDPEIDVVIELIDDAEEAFQLVKKAMESGKAVVSANKKMIATHMEELMQLQASTGLPLLYEASVCGSIPIIRLMEQQYGHDEVYALETISNGTCNYILSRIFEEQASYAEILPEAQERGLAESDPTLDVSGWDSTYKLAILLAHTFGAVADPHTILRSGIAQIKPEDVAFAQQQGGEFRLVGKAFVAEGKLVAYVLPQLVKPEHPFYQVRQEFNAVQTHALFAQEQWLIGKGAGSFPTTSSVLSDIQDAISLRHYALKKTKKMPRIAFDTQHQLKVYIRVEESVQWAFLPDVEVLEERANWKVVQASLKSLIAFQELGKEKAFIAVCE